MTARCEVPEVADFFSELLREIAMRYGSATTKTELADPDFQLVLQQMISEDERAKWQPIFEAARRAEKQAKARIEKGAKSRSEDSGHYVYSREKRKEIVDEYRQARSKGEVLTKDSWARTNYQISGRTLKRYEDEFPEPQTDT